MPQRAGGGRKKRRTHLPEALPPGESPFSAKNSSPAPPRSFVIDRGDVGARVKQLASDWRLLMSPFCASRLKGTRRNRIKDFVSASSVFGVTHLILLNHSSSVGPVLRLMRMPAGPTLTFRVKSFTLAADVAASDTAEKKRRKVSASAFHFDKSPFIVLGGFKGTGNPLGASTDLQVFPTSLLATFLGHMFPAIDVHAASAKDCRRVVLFNHDKHTHLIDMRQYIVIKKPAGVSRGVKRLISAKNSARKLLSLPEKEDIKQLLLDNDGYASDTSSTGETEVPSVTVEEAGGGGVLTPKKLAIKLSEIGPRLSLELIKIEEGAITKGKVLYHKYISKSPEELKELEQKEVHLRAKRQRELKEVLGEDDSTKVEGEKSPVARAKKKVKMSGAS